MGAGSMRTHLFDPVWNGFPKRRRLRKWLYEELPRGAPGGEKGTTSAVPLRPVNTGTYPPGLAIGLAMSAPLKVPRRQGTNDQRPKVRYRPPIGLGRRNVRKLGS